VPYVPVYTPEALRNYHDMAVVNPNDSMEDQLKAVYTAKSRNKKIAAGKMPKMLLPGYDVGSFRDDEIARERQNRLEQTKMDSTLLAAKVGTKAVKPLEQIGDGDVFITPQQLTSMGWNATSADNVNNLNQVMSDFGIVSPASVVMFLATAAHESGLGRARLEEGPDSHFANHGYDRYSRGAGYFQLTHSDMHLRFLRAMGDDFDGHDTATHIAENYPWVSAAWFWTNGTNIDLNTYASQHGTYEHIFLVTQYFVHGFPYGNNIAMNNLLDQDLRGIRLGELTYSTSDERLYVSNGNSHPLPCSWNDRVEFFRILKEIFGLN